jgi:proline iminopeptidase
MIIRENEKNKTFDNDEYKGAVDLYYSLFLKRKERPKSQADSAKMYFETNVYEFMWGPSEFTATGNLLHYDRVNRLKDITVPTLLLAGEYDEARPSTVRYFQSLIPNSEFIEIKNSGHSTMHDNPKQALAAINQFVLKVDKLKD